MQVDWIGKNDSSNMKENSSSLSCFYFLYFASSFGEFLESVDEIFEKFGTV
jgi:hypothetical protein